MIQRRDFFKTALFLYLTKQNLLADEVVNDSSFMDFFSSLFSNSDDAKKQNINIDKSKLTDVEKRVFKNLEKENSELKNKIEKIETSEEIVLEEVDIKEKFLPNQTFHNDLFIEDNYLNDFVSVRDKLTKVQRYVGYGNFNIISFDDMLKIAKYNNKIGKFSKSELEFLEFIFYRDPNIHGFFGNRISSNITDKINKKDVVKIPHTGHYLFKGHSQKTYNKMVNDIGETIFLTSGVRSIVKQTKLFLDKLESVNGNISVASKSLAPPAYTYHLIGDFDVGKKGLGYDNFTSRFALTQEFFAMRKLKYIDMRYTINNKDGVRYEPWHIKVI